MNDPRGRTTGEDPVRGVREARLEPLEELRPGERLGGERAYRLVEELGEGGMGRVFLAERSDGEFRQRVAIKLLRWNLGGDADAARRFRAERQILARLNHPNIARLLDGGTTAQGQPFLVMEYIEGAPIDDDVVARALSVEQKLRLFLKVCDAVRVAHQSLVVHRDLKPANILVDGSGEPKLLDFGIAKLLDPDLVGDAAETRRGETLLTPRYASPEQITAGAITTASDIYSLGVILYELLTGQAPYNVTLTAPMELVRAICETTPAPPSASSAGRATGSQRIPRDLDEIVLKALRKEPRDRYESVDALAEDLRRFLDGRPVEARRGGRSYRMARFARRHRWALAAAALFLLTVAAFIAGLARQLGETARQRDEAARQRDTAQAVTDFLVKLFAASDPNEARGAEISARAVLDRGAERIDAELAAQPAIRATLLHNLGLVYHNLGVFDRAAELFGSALAARERLLEPGDPDRIETLYRFGWNEAQRGRRSEGERLLRAALAEIDLASEPLPGVEVMILNGLGATLVYENRYAEAEEHLLRALGRRGAHGVAGDGPFLGTLNNLGLLNLYQERWEVAIPYFRQALEIEKAMHGERHPNEVILHSNLSWCLSGVRRFEEAEREARRASEVGHQVLGPLHVVTLYAHYRLGWALHHLGRFEEAEKVQREALAGRQATRVGSPFFEITASLHTLAQLLSWKGDLDESIEIYREAVAQARNEMPPETEPEILVAEAELAEVLSRAGRQEEALELLATVRGKLARLPAGKAHAEAEVHYTRVLSRRPASRDEAAKIVRDLLPKLADRTPAERQLRRLALATLAEIDEATGDRTTAAKRWNEALVFEGDLAPGDPEYGRAARELERLSS